MGDIVITPASNDVNSTAGTLNIRTSDSYPMLLKTSNVERISITAAGLVGIGTTAPTGKLHVYSSITGDTLIRADGTNGTIFSVTDDLSNSLLSVNNSAGLPVLEVFADDSVVMGQYGSGDLVVKNNEVGIGTTNPINKLSVIGNASIGSTGYNVNGPSNGLIVEGNIGIGTTNPSQKLEVQGNIKLGADNAGSYIYYIKDSEGTIIRTIRSDASQQGLFRSDGWGNFTVDNSIGIGYSLGGINFASSNIGNGNLYVANRIGVGTTVPTGLLNVVGATTAGLLNLYATSFPGNVLRLNSNFAGGNYVDINPYISSVSNAGFEINLNGVNRLTIQSNGNVGIGNNIPTGLLNVIRNSSTAQPIAFFKELFGTPPATNILLLERGNNLTAPNQVSSNAGLRIRDHSANYSLSVEDHNSNVNFAISGAKVMINSRGTSSLLNIGGAGSTAATSGITFGEDAQANLYRIGEDSIQTDGNLYVAGTTVLQGDKYLTTLKSVFLVARGAGLNNNASRYLAINNNAIYNNTSRGLRLTIINATNLAVVSNTDYDTVGSDAACDDLATAINGMTSQQIGVLTSYDAWERDRASLRAAALNVGLTKLGTYSTGGTVRKPYAAVFNGTSDTANATTKHVIERMESSDADATRALITTYLTTDGAYASIDAALHMPNALYASDADIEYPIVLVDSVGRVGIGTTVPSGALNIISRGNVGFVPTTTAPIGGSINTRVHIQGAEPGLMLSSDIQPVTGIQTNTQTYQLGLQIGYYAANDVRNQIYFGNGPLTFTYSANQGVAVTERMRIDTAGRVGIGTTSALAQLHVTGQTYLTNVVASVARNQLTINTNGANYAHFYDVGVSANNALAIGGNGAIGTVPTKAIMSWRLSTENVGIGLTNPEATSALHIKNLDAAAKVTIESADASESYINFSAQSSEYSVGFVRDGSNVNSLRFCNADSLSANEVMRLQNTNVGIGTNNPIFGLDVYKDTFRSLSRVSEKIITVIFPHNVANQKVDIIFDVTPGAYVFWGNLEVEIVDEYNNQLATGKLIKVFALGLNPATGSGPYGPSLYDNTSYYTAAYGAVADNYAIDGIFFNTTTGKYYLTIIHRNSSGNTPAIKIKGFSSSVTNSVNINSLTASAVYTTNTTVYYKPVVETLQSRIGFNGNINQSADLLVRGLVGLGTTNPSSRLVLGSNFASVTGITVSTDNSLESQFVARKAASKCAFGILAWEAETYLSAGTYYNNGNWQQHNANNNNLLFVLVPGGGVNWYASNNGSASWNVVEALNLWDEGGRWKSSIRSTRVEDSYILNGKFGIGTSSSTTLLSVGPAGSTTAASGITFGADAQANLYRSAEDTIKTDGSLNVAGLIYNSNSAYYSSVSKSTTANWGQYTVVLGNASYSANIIHVSVNGGNLVWAGTFLASCHLSYRPNETWINVKLLECATYNCGNDDVTLLALSNSSTSQYGVPSLVLKTNGNVNGGYGTGYANNIVVTVNGPSPNEFVLSSSSWAQPYTYQIATSANTKQIYVNESGNVGIGTVFPTNQANYKFLQVNGTNSAVIETMVGGARIGGFDSTASALYVGTIGNFPVIFRTAVDEKMRIAAGGNVGIGITNPTQKLDIVGSYGAPDDNAGILKIRGAGVGPTQLNFGISADGGYGWIQATDIAVDNDRNIILGPLGGNVGIGTTNPSHKLHVYAKGNGAGILIESDPTDNANQAPALKLYPKSTNANERNWAISPFRNNPQSLSISSSDAKGGDPYSNATTRLIIDGINGNVGIGIIDPTYPLHVANAGVYHITAEQTKTNTGDASAYATFYVLNNAGTSQLRGYFGAGGASVGNTAMQNHVYIGAQSNHGVRFFTNDTAKVTIQAGGNVGIGTTNPYSLLDVQVASASPRYVTISTNDGQGSYYGFGLNFRIANNSHDIGQIRGVYENSNGGGYGGLAIATRSAGTLYDRVTFTDQGRVGIGTSSPTTLLSVGGLGSTTAASGITFGGDSVANLYRISASRLKTDGFLTIDGGGGGATNLLLNRSSSSNENGMAFTTAGSVDWYYYVDNATTNLQIQKGNELDSAPRVRFNGANSDILFNLGGGNIGVGTATPTGKLHIYSTITGQTLLRADGTNGTIFSVIDDLSNSLLSVNNSAGIPVLEVFADDSIVMGQYGSGDLVVTNNKVGIGTTNPTNKLSVIGGASIGSTYNVSAPANGLIVQGTVGIGLTNPTQKLHVKSSVGQDGVMIDALQYSEVAYKINGSAIKAYAALSSIAGGYVVGSSANAFIIRNDSDIFMTADAGVTSNITIKNNGNVGIGLTNPSDKFVVNGNIGFSGDANRYILMPDVNQGVGSIYMQAGFGSAAAGGAIKLHGHNATTYVGGDVEVGLSTKGDFLINNYIGGNRLVTVKAAGNVGIGITNPAYKLVVSGGDVNIASANILRFGTVAVLNENSNANDIYANIRVIRNYSSVNQDGMYIGYDNQGTTNAHLRFYANGGNERMRIDASNGNVGIGVTNPTTRLQVANTGTITSVATIRIVGSTGNNAGSQVEFYKAQTAKAAVGLASAVVGGGTSDDLLLLSANPASIVFNAGANGLAAFKSDGNVGIGLTNPAAARLHIKGDGAAPVLRVESADLQSAVGGTAGKNFVGWLPIMTGALGTDKVFIPLYK